MKSKLLIILFTLLKVNVFAITEFDVRENGNSYSFVDSLSVAPEVAYSNAQNWVIKSSTSYKASVQFEDKEQKKLIIKSGVVYPYKKASNVEPYLVFDLTIELKEGKFRIKLENIKYYAILHYTDIGYIETGDDVSEVDIISFSGYKKDAISGLSKFTYEEEYDNNKLKMQSLLNKKSIAKKKKEINQIDHDIEILNYRQNTLEEWRNNYIKINSTINSYVANLSKQLNTNDDF